MGIAGALAHRNDTKKAIGVGAQWELRLVPARWNERFASCSSARHAHVVTLQRPWLGFRDPLQAAFRTSTGSSRSASRYSIRNGDFIEPSPGLPRGGGIAERCAGVRPK